MADLGAIGYGDLYRDYVPICPHNFLTGCSSNIYRDYCPINNSQILTGARDGTTGFCIFCDLLIYGESNASVTLVGLAEIEINASPSSTGLVNLTGKGNIETEADADSTAEVDLEGVGTTTISASGDSTAEIIITGLGNIVLESDGDSNATINLTWIQSFEFGATADSTSTVRFQTVSARTILNINPRQPSTRRLDWTNDSWFMRKVSASKPYTRTRF